MKVYCAGFVFNETRDKVALILKNRPAWQKGCYNGIGGHVESLEEPVSAQSREFFEEAGLLIEPAKWQEVVVLQVGDAARVHFFMAFGDLDEIESKTDELVVICDVKSLPNNVHRNLRWLVPMCLDHDLQFPIYINDVAAHKG